jgi:hypothetical protein
MAHQGHNGLKMVLVEEGVRESLFPQWDGVYCLVPGGDPSPLLSAKSRKRRI